MAWRSSITTRLAIGAVVGAVVACGDEPKVADAPFDPALVYTRAALKIDGVIGWSSSSPFQTLELDEDGMGRRLTKRCGSPDDVSDPFSWSHDGNLVTFSGIESGETFATLTLESDICARHEYATTPGLGASRTLYFTGEYCETNVRDNGHVGVSCDWEACDGVSDGCRDQPFEG